MMVLMCLTFALQAQRIVFTPQWTPQAQFAGYYVAFETYLSKRERHSYYIRTDRIEWSKLKRVTGIGFDFSGKKTQEEFILKLINLTVIN